jgi:hypothetical protein
MRTLRTLLLTCAALMMSVSLSSAQGVSDYMPYQGFLADATGAAVNGQVSLTFKLYESSNAPNALWEETIPGVVVTEGAFSVSLGEVSPNMKSYITDGRAQYLSVAVNGESVSPRQRIGTQAYAFLSYNASRLGGYGPEHFATLEQLNELTLQAGAGLTAAQVEGLIDQRGYLSQAAIEALIDARGYLNQAAITNLINQLIDARGYLSQAEITNLINTAVTNAANAANAQITNLSNQLNTLNAQVTNLQNQVNNLNVGAAVEPEVLGLSNTASTGRFSFNGQQGIRAANEMCKASFANVATAHFCSVDEVTRALALGNVDASVNNQETWTVATSVVEGFNATDSLFNTCQNLLYSSGDVANGTYLTVSLGYTSAGGGGGGTGDVVKVTRNRGCGNSRKVMCCR